MSQTFELSSLHDYICRALVFTEAVKTTLEFECTEARYALKPWDIKTTVIKEIDKDTCICEKDTSESQAEEISEGIGRAILQAQQLRETLWYNISNQEKRIKEPNLRNIYTSKLSLDKTKSQQLCHKPQKTGAVNSSVRPKVKPLDKNIKTTQNVIKTVSQTVIGRQESASKIHEKAQVLSKSKRVGDINAGTGDIKQKGKKNFLLANKLHIKNITSIHNDNKNKEVINNAGFSNTKIKPVICPASTSELTKLIEEISLSSSQKMSINSVNANCPLHGDNAAQFTEEVRTESMSIVDVLYKLDVPRDILKILRTYHSYINLECKKKSVRNSQRQKAIAPFLKEFEKMNKMKQNCVEDKFVNVAMQSMSVFANVSNEIVNHDEIQNFEKELGSIYKIHKIKRFDKDSTESIKPYNTKLKYSEITGWMSNGIWNSVCIRDLQGMSGTCCISYNNMAQLSSFLEVLQQFQQTEYLNTMIEILLQDVIPKAMQFFKPTDAAYLQIYKLINILSQGLNSKHPVLVKTEE